MTALASVPIRAHDRAQVGTWRQAALEGARDMTPMIIGIIPFALAVGAVIGSSTVPSLAGWIGAPLIFAGAAQLTAVQMLEAGVAPVVIVASALSLNARVMMYGAAIAPWFRTAPLRHRLLLALPLIDPLYVTSASRFEKRDLDDRGRQAYYSGAAVFLAVVWLAVQAIAIVAEASLPDSIGLDIAAPLAFAGLLAKSTAARPAVVAAVTAAIVATVGAGLPFQSAIPVAAVAGVAVGDIVTRHDRAGADR